MDALTVEALSPDDLDDLAALFGTRGDPSWCWCQWYMVRGRDLQNHRVANRAAFERQLRSEPEPMGVLARKGDEPVGWLALGPRRRYARITASPSRAAIADDMSDARIWAATCFVVKVGHRRQGIGAALLDAGVELARNRGARMLEAHPVDLAARERSPGSAALFSGAVSTFERAGFVEVGRTSRYRPVMRLDLAVSPPSR